MHMSYLRIGGILSDVPADFVPKVKAFIDDFPEKMEDYEGLLTKNRIWLNRTKGVGVITAEEGIALGLSGPSIRACGVKWDLRRTNPYSGYERFSFEVPTGTQGDVYDRYLVRIAEMRQSTEIIKQAIAGLPPGEVNAYAPKVVPPPKEKVYTSIEALIHQFHIMVEGFDVPEGEVYVAVESPRGDLGFYVKSDGGSKPFRLKIRTPSFVNLQSLSRMAEGRMMADMVAVIGSIDIVLGEVDR